MGYLRTDHYSSSATACNVGLTMRETHWYSGMIPKNGANGNPAKMNNDCGIVRMVC
jgi:hypothetical protein